MNKSEATVAKGKTLPEMIKVRNFERNQTKKWNPPDLECIINLFSGKRLKRKRSDVQMSRISIE